MLESQNYRYEEAEEPYRMHLNECLYNPPEYIIKAVTSTLSQCNYYPNLHMFNRFRLLLAEYNKVSIDNVYPFLGADNALRTLFMALADPGDTILFVKPTFSMIEVYARFMGLDMVTVPLQENDDEWTVDMNLLIELAKNAHLVVLVDPNNPTGNAIIKGDRKILEAIALNTKGFVIVDETYYEFSGYSVARYVNEYPNVIVVRSMSKAFCLAGFRLGYIIADKSVIDSVTKVLTPFDIPTPSLAAGIAALENLDYHLKIIEKIKQLRDYLYSELKRMGFKVYRSYANFLLIRDDRRLDSHLKKFGIAIKRVAQDLYRVSIGNEDSVKLFIESLRELA